MSTGEFGVGVVLAALPAVAALLLAWRVVRLRLAHLAPVEAVGAGALITVATLMGIHLAPLLLGILGQASILVTAALVAAAALALRPGAPGAADPAPPPAPASGPVSWGIAAVAGLVVLAMLAADLRELLPTLIIGIDTPGFHLPQAARWIDSGSLWQIDEFFPGQPHGYYPGNGVLLFTWTMLPLESEVLVRPVITAFMPLWAAAVWLAGRELGAPPATRVIAAAALLATPIVVQATVPRAMADVVLYAAMTAGVAFLLRHGRSGRRSDLILAGIGLGIGAGTKWYGVPAAIVILAVWAVPRLREAARRRALPFDLLSVGGPALAGALPWLTRNLVESGNPVFPQEVSILGLELFDAPRDLAREESGFAIADYATDTGVWGDIAAELVQGLGVVALAAVVLVIAGLVAAARRRAGLPAALGVGAVCLAAAYATTPYSALGADGQPVLLDVNTRYVVPAVIAAVLTGLWLARGSTVSRIAVDVGLAAVALLALEKAFRPELRPTLTALVAVVVAVAAVVVLRLGASRLQPAARPFAVAALGVVVALGGLAYLARVEDRFDAARASTGDEVLTALGAKDREPPLHVGIIGRWRIDQASPIWPAFGPRGRNRVETIAEDRDGFLIAPTRAADFERIVGRRRYDALVVARGAGSKSREESWADGAGYVRTVQSLQFALYVDPRAVGRKAATP